MRSAICTGHSTLATRRNTGCLQTAPAIKASRGECNGGARHSIMERLSSFLEE